jgi:hypothetical protein
MKHATYGEIRDERVKEIVITRSPDFLRSKEKMKIHDMRGRKQIKRR